MDLSTLNYDPDEAFEVELRGPDGALLTNDDGSVMSITTLGADSEVAVKARNAAANRRIQAGPRAKITSESLDADGASYLAKLGTGWNITMGGGKPDFSYEALLKLYTDRKFAFIREQMDDAVAARARFLKDSPKT